MKSNENQKSKSIAKALGVKSTFVLDDNHILITSFGKGNDAIVEKIIDDEVHNKKTPASFDATMPYNASTSEKNNTNGHKIDIKNGKNIVVVKGDERTRVNQTSIDVPNVQNALHAKAEIEKIIFGKSFADNIHIQIAYNILDLKKLFTVYANAIVNSVDTLTRYENGTDYLGMFYTYNEFELAEYANLFFATKVLKQEEQKISIDTKIINQENKSKAIKKLYDYIIKTLGLNNNCKLTEENILQFFRLQGFNNPKAVRSASDDYRGIGRIRNTALYFQDAFLSASGEFDSKKAFTMTRLLSQLRQSSVHYDPRARSFFFNIEDINDTEIENKKELLDFINDLFNNKLTSINKKFIKTNKVNLAILFDIYNKKDKQVIANEFYDFVVRKTYKNMGFSIKLIREAFLQNNEARYLTYEKFDTCRAKLYNLIDFAIYNYFVMHEEEQISLVDKLRASTSDEDKQLIYNEYGKKVWDALKYIINKKIVPSINPQSLNAKKRERVFDKDFSDVIVTNPNGITMFAKAMYCVSLLLDGKDINVFLTSIKNKLDNIASLSQTLEDNGLEINFAKDYSLFANSKKLAEDIAFVKSISKMSKSVKTTKQMSEGMTWRLYEDAAALLGEFDKETIQKALAMDEEAMSIKNANKARIEELDEELVFDRNNQKLKIEKSKCKNENARLNSFRNFIVSNIINSKKFAYVCRYINPKYAKDIMSNQALVKACLATLPEKQLVRYCKPIQIKGDTIAEKLDKLVDALNNVSFSSFYDVEQKSNNPTKEKYKALIGLYLFVLHRVVKTMVNINVTYSIAMGELEKDMEIISLQRDNALISITDSVKKEKISQIKLGKKNGKYISITDYFVQMGYVKHSRINERFDLEYAIKHNRKDKCLIKYYSDNAFRKYRNNIEHMSVISHLYEFIGEIDRIDIDYQKLNAGGEISCVEFMFDVYHYILFRLVQSVGAFDSAVNDEIVPAFEKYHSVNMKHLGAMMLPFAYNPPRYINLCNKKYFVQGFGK